MVNLLFTGFHSNASQTQYCLHLGSVSEQVYADQTRSGELSHRHQLEPSVNNVVTETDAIR